jgi:hypothetical protein
MGRISFLAIHQYTKIYMEQTDLNDLSLRDTEKTLKVAVKQCVSLAAFFSHVKESRKTVTSPL